MFISLSTVLNPSKQLTYIGRLTEESANELHCEGPTTDRRHLSQESRALKTLDPLAKKLIRNGEEAPAEQEGERKRTAAGKAGAKEQRE